MILLEKVNKRFRRNRVLKDIDLAIQRDSRVALVGSNGAGKTTLIRCLLGEYNYQGRITVDGLEPRSQRQQLLAKVGFVPQLPPPLKMPVGQLIRFAASVCDADPKRMEAVSKRLGLDPGSIRHQPFVKLSGGQKQKLLISIALGRDSELLVLDEPAANLDPDARRMFYQLLEEKRDDAVMLISSHRLDEVASLVNRVVEMDQGSVVLDDRVADDISLMSRLKCRVGLVRPEQAFAKVIQEWGFRSADGGYVWEGEVAGPDRLRFLAVLSRYAALLTSIEIDEVKSDEEVVAVYN